VKRKFVSTFSGYSHSPSWQPLHIEIGVLLLSGPGSCLRGEWNKCLLSHCQILWFRWQRQFETQRGAMILHCSLYVILSISSLSSIVMCH
jgi:hypothetical protein